MRQPSALNGIENSGSFPLLPDDTRIFSLGIPVRSNDAVQTPDTPIATAPIPEHRRACMRISGSAPVHR